MKNNKEKYYLKQGKLDLVLLDEGREIDLDENSKMNEDEMMMNFAESFVDIELELNQEKSIKEDTELKMSQETYETLKELGDFFTQKN